jgi:hypothetical protein
MTGTRLGELLGRPFAARAAVRTAAALALAAPYLWHLPGDAATVAAGYVAAVVAATLLVERAAAQRAIQRGASAWRCGAEASVA